MFVQFRVLREAVRQRIMERVNKFVVTDLDGNVHDICRAYFIFNYILMCAITNDREDMGDFDLVITHKVNGVVLETAFRKWYTLARMRHCPYAIVPGRFTLFTILNIWYTDIILRQRLHKMRVVVQRRNISREAFWELVQTKLDLNTNEIIASSRQDNY